MRTLHFRSICLGSASGVQLKEEQRPNNNSPQEKDNVGKQSMAKHLNLNLVDWTRLSKFHARDVVHVVSSHGDFPGSSMHPGRLLQGHERALIQ